MRAYGLKLVTWDFNYVTMGVGEYWNQDMVYKILQCKLIKDSTLESLVHIVYD